MAVRNDGSTQVVLPCGAAFDVVNAPAIFGRRMLDQLWGEGPGSGPVAVHRGRMLLFAAPGTAQRLPVLLKWEEWGSDRGAGRSRAVPPLLCHGRGDAVSCPPAGTTPGDPAPVPTPARWLVARHPAALAAGPGAPASGGGTRGSGGPDIDFPSPGSGC